jgi:two-component system, cell cycle sensor histidine kinase and response regulator CckA
MTPVEENDREPLVLVVDDEPGVTAVLLFVLRRLGYHAMALSDPREALRMVQQREVVPVLLITDQAMPFMSGLELLRRSRELLPDLKSILCTGEVTDSELALAAVRPDRVLEKPFDTETLMEAVRSLVTGLDPAK